MSGFAAQALFKLLNRHRCFGSFFNPDVGETPFGGGDGLDFLNIVKAGKQDLRAVVGRCYQHFALADIEAVAQDRLGSAVDCLDNLVPA